ncbi:MAG: hypothetical protein R2725_03920 [Solirubrobacterales bacterium]
MSILDDAIREHLELKRAHGADESELKRLESEAFGPAERAEEASPFEDEEEAPTEFLGAPEADPEQSAGRRQPNIADLQEAPPPPTEEPEAAAPSAAPDAAAPEPPVPPAEESHPATELRTIPDPAAGGPPAEEDAAAPTEEPAEAAPPPEARQPAPPESPNTEERHAIAAQPTQFFDIEAEIAGGEEGASPPTPASGLEAEAENAAAAEDPLVDEEEDEEDDFFSEQRLSDELDQALEAPLPSEERPRSRADEPVPPGPHTEEAEAHYAERESEEYDEEVFEPEDSDHDDVLEDTPDFLEDAPDADDAWFEQRPPKDFDFDD